MQNECRYFVGAYQGKSKFKKRYVRVDSFVLHELQNIRYFDQYINDNKLLFDIMFKMEFNSQRWI